MGRLYFWWCCRIYINATAIKRFHQKIVWIHFTSSQHNAWSITHWVELSPNLHTKTKNVFSFLFLTQPGISCWVAQVITDICLWFFFWQWYSLHTPWLISAGAKGLLMTLRNGGTTGVHRWLMRMDFIAPWAGTQRRACGLCVLPVLPLSPILFDPFKEKMWNAPVIFK